VWGPQIFESPLRGMVRTGGKRVYEGVGKKKVWVKVEKLSHHVGERGGNIRLSFVKYELKLL